MARQTKLQGALYNFCEDHKSELNSDYSTIKNIADTLGKRGYAHKKRGVLGKEILENSNLSDEGKKVADQLFRIENNYVKKVSRSSRPIKDSYQVRSNIVELRKDLRNNLENKLKSTQSLESPIEEKENYKPFNTDKKLKKAGSAFVHALGYIGTAVIAGTISLLAAYHTTQPQIDNLNDQVKSKTSQIVELTNKGNEQKNHIEDLEGQVDYFAAENQKLGLPDLDVITQTKNKLKQELKQKYEPVIANLQKENIELEARLMKPIHNRDYEPSNVYSDEVIALANRYSERMAQNEVARIQKQNKTNFAKSNSVDEVILKPSLIEPELASASYEAKIKLHNNVDESKDPRIIENIEDSYLAPSTSFVSNPTPDSRMNMLGPVIEKEEVSQEKIKRLVDKDYKPYEYTGYLIDKGKSQGVVEKTLTWGVGVPLSATNETLGRGAEEIAKPIGAVSRTLRNQRLIEKGVSTVNGGINVIRRARLIENGLNLIGIKGPLKSAKAKDDLTIGAFSEGYHNAYDALTFWNEDDPTENTWKKGAADAEETNDFFWRNVGPLPPFIFTSGPNYNKSHAEGLEWIAGGFLGEDKSLLDFKTENDPYVIEDGIPGAAIQIGSDVSWLVYHNNSNQGNSHKNPQDPTDPTDSGFERIGGELGPAPGRVGGGLQ